MSESKKWLSIRRATNGFIVQGHSTYGVEGDPEIFPTYEDAIESISKALGETSFGDTLKHASAMTRALTNLCEVAVAPKLLAIEARVVPGVENLVDD